MTPYEPTASYMFGASFRQLRHALGTPVTGAPSFAHWLHGERHGVEVIVLTYPVVMVTADVPGIALGYPSTPGTRSTLTYTGAFARIDPPLFLGVGINPKPSFLHRDLFGPKTIKTGDKNVDRDLALVSADAEQARAFFSARDPDGAALLKAMTAARAAGDGLLVSDSLVLCPKAGILTDHGLADRLLDRATDLARACGMRRRAVPLPAKDRQVHHAWAHFAATHGFAYDDARLVLEGTVDGSVVEIALENEGREMRTVVTVRFPSPVAVAFSATRAKEGHLHGLPHRDIEVGHSTFDELFTVAGHPEAAVKALFAAPDLVDVLVRIALRCSDVQMNHLGIHVRLPGACSSVEELDAIAVMAHVATHALFRRASAGAYRT